MRGFPWKDYALRLQATLTEESPMKVDRLIVLTLTCDHHAKTMDDDLRDGAALAVKFGEGKAPSKADDSGFAELKKFANGAAYEIAGFDRGVESHSSFVVRAHQGKLGFDAKALKRFLEGAKNCGMYVVAHGTGGMITPYKSVVKEHSPANVAKMINELVPKKLPLMKVNLVACSLVGPPEDGDIKSKDRSRAVKFLNKDYEKIEEKNFVASVCSHLNRPETMVAGYSVPVNVGRDKNPEFQTVGVDGDQRPESATIGRKTATVSEQTGIRKITSENRSEVKSVYRLDKKGKVEKATLQQYSSHQ